MRLKQSDLKPYVVKESIPKKDTDGTTYEGWADEGHTIRANIQPAGGKIMSEMYGERLAYMLTLYTEKSTNLKETNGLCVYVSSDQDPDYRVIAIRRWSSHTVAVLEKVT